MYVPPKIRVAGVDYSVEYVEDLNDGCKVLYGEINYMLSKIKLHAGQSHQLACITLWHEILHALVENAGMEVENEEEIVNMFSRGIYQVLQDNGRNLFDISTPIKEETK